MAEHPNVATVREGLACRQRSYADMPSRSCGRFRVEPVYPSDRRLVGV